MAGDNTGDNTAVDGSSSSADGLSEGGTSGRKAAGAVDAAMGDEDPPAPPDAVTLAPPAAPTGTASTGTASTGVSTSAPSLRFETPTVLAPPADYSQAGVPSLDFVRDKIEGRYAKSLGSTELAQETPEARSFEEQAAKRADAAKEKLDAIRRSLRGDSSS